MKVASWELISKDQVSKDLDFSSFEHNTSTIPRDFYYFFNVDLENKQKVDIVLKDESGKIYFSYIRHASQSRGNSPVKLIKWNKDFTNYLKLNFPDWNQIKQGDKQENYKLIFRKTSKYNYEVRTEETNVKYFSELLKNQGLDPKEVQLVKHKRDIQDGMDKTYFTLWKTDREMYDYESSTQRKNRFGDRKYLATFVVNPFNEVLLASFYKIGKQIEDNQGGYSYELKRDDALKDFEGKLIIDWGGARSSYQIAGNTPKEIVDFDSIYNKIQDEIQEEIEEEIITDSVDKTSISTKQRTLSTKEYEVARNKLVKRKQKENELVSLYKDFLDNKGYKTKHSQVDLIAEKNGKTIYIEAKILKSPTTAAHGLGQILHYDFILDKKADELGLLFDRKPNDQTIEFIKQFKVKITYKEKDNFITI